MIYPSVGLFKKTQVNLAQDENKAYLKTKLSLSA